MSFIFMNRDVSNSLHLFVGRRRWLKKRLGNWLPDLGYLTLEDGLRLFVELADMRGPSFNVLYGGQAAFVNYERVEKDELLAALPPGGVFLDIGANIGLFAVYIQRRAPAGCATYAFEPHPRLQRALARTISENSLGKLLLEPFAVGRSAGEMELFFDETDSGGHSAFRETLQNNRGEARSAKVRRVALDEWVRERGLGRVDAIKIDVQGGEAEVIAGARETLRRFKPTLLIEVDYPSLLSGGGGHLADLLAGLEGVKYALRIPGMPEILPLQGLRETADRETARGILQRNYLFVATD